MFTKLWERYIFLELVKVFVFFLFCFYFLFSLIDYTTHMQDFSFGGKLQLGALFSYYSFQFIKRATLLLPLALMIATIKVLAGMNSSKELVAMQACGLKLKTLLRPFFFLALLCTIFNWISAEKILPRALNSLDNFKANFYQQDLSEDEPFHVLHLKDQSKLVYQSLHKESGQLIDVYWIRNVDDIWKMKTLLADPKNPVAQYVDHITRSKEGSLSKVESFDMCKLTGLKWEFFASKKGMIPLENRRASQLFKVLFHRHEITSRQASEVLTLFTYKMVIPLLAILVVISVVPYCIRYSRSLPMFLIYAVSLFGFISFFTLIDACVILGSHNTLHPLVALLCPFALCFGLFSFKFIKTL